MGPMILKREVLPPRQTPREADFTVEAQTASVTRAIWMMMMVIGLAQVILRMLEMYP